MYIVRAGRAVKIGYSRNLDKRVYSMQTANAETLEVLLALPFGSEPRARAWEKMLHAACSEFRIRGEWFSDECLPAAEAWMRKYGVDVSLAVEPAPEPPTSKASFAVGRSGLMAHLWTGEDTECGAYSDGSLRDPLLVEESEGRYICENCRHAVKRRYAPLAKQSCG